MIVIGPAARFPDALLLAEKSLPDAAVLDVRLEMGTTLPLAVWLATQAFHFCFRRADPSLIDAAHAGVPVLRKPFRREQLIGALAALLGQRTING
jgi:hypothetical protein